MLGFDFFRDSRLKIEVEDCQLKYREDGPIILAVAPENLYDFLGQFACLAGLLRRQRSSWRAHLGAN